MNSEEPEKIEQCPKCGHCGLLKDYSVFTTTHDAEDYLRCPKCDKMFKPKK
jgi:uncharacterized C2H2 Zn-finger protein